MKKIRMKLFFFLVSGFFYLPGSGLLAETLWDIKGISYRESPSVWIWSISQTEWDADLKRLDVYWQTKTGTELGLGLLYINGGNFDYDDVLRKNTLLNETVSGVAVGVSGLYRAVWRHTLYGGYFARPSLGYLAFEDSSGKNGVCYILETGLEAGFRIADRLVFGLAFGYRIMGDFRSDLYNDHFLFFSPFRDLRFSIEF